MKTFLQKGFQTFQKTFGQWIRLKIRFAFRALLGRAARYLLSANYFALSQSLSPLCRAPDATYLYKITENQSLYDHINNISNRFSPFAEKIFLNVSAGNTSLREAQHHSPEGRTSLVRRTDIIPIRFRLCQTVAIFQDI